VADIFISYTSSDRDWAFWIGQQLEKPGHKRRSKREWNCKTASSCWVTICGIPQASGIPHSLRLLI
jgi:hypothetical protein